LGKTGRGNPYLWWRPGRVDRDGVERGGLWHVVHKGEKWSARCSFGPDEERRALQVLEDYKATLHVTTQPASVQKGRPAHEVYVAEVLDRYREAKLGVVDPDTGEMKDGVARHEELAQRILTLLGWWGEKTLADVDSATCKAYVKARVGQPWRTHARAGKDKDGKPLDPKAEAKPKRRGHSKPAKQRVLGPGGARRELEDLRAAINAAIRDGLTRDQVHVTLPPKGEERDRWLTVPEAALIVRRAWRKVEVQTVHRGERKGERVIGRRVGKHLARFVIVALRTGTRSGPICGASFEKQIGKPWMELKTETSHEERIETRVIDGETFERRVRVPVIKRVAIFHRKALGTKEAENKKAPTVRMPDGLVAHLWRWHHVLGQKYVVEWNGKPVGSTKRSFANLVHELGLGDDVVRHSLRHTAVTWGMQAGVDIWELAGYVGMTVEMIERRYGHHSSEHMEGAREALGGRGRKRRAA
ncbi:MAG: hypothetical protein MIL41_04015, partial [Hyphomicrobiales bacterium]